MNSGEDIRDPKGTETGGRGPSMTAAGGWVPPIQPWHIKEMRADLEKGMGPWLKSPDFAEFQKTRKRMGGRYSRMSNAAIMEEIHQETCRMVVARKAWEWKTKVEKTGIALETYNRLLRRQTGHCKMCRVEATGDVAAAGEPFVAYPGSGTGKIEWLICKDCRHLIDWMWKERVGVERLAKFVRNMKPRWFALPVPWTPDESSEKGKERTPPGAGSDTTGTTGGGTPAA